MTTTKPPLLTERAIKVAMAQAGFGYDENLIEFARIIEHLALARAGADAVRDAAQINHHTGGRYISYIEHPADCEVSYPEDEQFTARVRPALKVTPAAAVADREESDDLEDAAIRAMEAKGAAVAVPHSSDAYLDEIAQELGDSTLTSYSQVATGIRDLKERLQLSGNAGEVDVSALLALLGEIANANSAQVAPVYANLARAAIAASKGANHG